MIYNTFSGDIIQFQKKQKSKLYPFALSESLPSQPKGYPKSDFPAMALKIGIHSDNIAIMKILLVEDDERIASFIMKGFKEAGFVIDPALDGETGLSMALAITYDAAIVDIMLPQRDGISLIEELRHQSVNTPVIILSARHSLDDRIKGIQSGGDDYLVKPFAFSELLVRVQALIRRASGTMESFTLSYSDLTLDMYRREAHRSGVKIDLPPREFELMEYLTRNAERIISKTMILDHVWKFNFDPQTNVVDVLVCRLRNKIDRDFPKKLIHTIRGIGYVLKDPSKNL